MQEAGLKLRKWMTAAAIMLCAAAIVVISKGYFDGKYQSVETFGQYIKSYGLWGPIVLTIIQLFQVVVPVVPGMVGCAAGAMLFGGVGGFLINYIGISAGSIVAFWLGRKYGTSFVKKVVGEEKYEKYVGWIMKHKSYTVIFALMILLPLAPDDFFCYFSGLTKMSLKKFTWIILSMKPWCILFYSVIFSGILL